MARSLKLLVQQKMAIELSILFCERYANRILWSSALNMILVSWGVTEKKMCCGGEVLYRSK